MSSALLAHMNSKMAAHKQAVYTAIMVEAYVVVNDLAELGPADTGASAGSTERARRSIYPSHPAYGMIIGNMPGNSGWQVQADNYSYYNMELCISVGNPMWEPYLKAYNYGMLGPALNRGRRPVRNFLQKAWMNHQTRGAFTWH